MIGLEFEIDFIGDEDLIRGIREMEAAFTSFRVPLEKAGDRAGASIGENIVRNIDDFAPLAPSTLYATAADRLGGPLYRHGNLMEAASDTTGTIIGSGYTLTDDEVRVGLDPDSELGEIGEMLTRGNTENNLPARVFVRILESDIQATEGYFEEYIEQVVQSAFSSRRA